jgi:hypothetical protein
MGETTFFILTAAGASGGLCRRVEDVAEISGGFAEPHFIVQREERRASKGRRRFAVSLVRPVRLPSAMFPAALVLLNQRCSETETYFAA